MYSRAERFSFAAKVLLYAILLVWTFYALLPLYWIFTTAFKTQAEAGAYPPTLIPRHFTVATFSRLFSHYSFGFRPYLNSIILSVGATLVAVTLSSLAGYGFSRFRFPGRRFLLLFLLLMNLLPTLIMIVPLYRLFILYHIYNTYIGLILIYGVTSAPFCTWLMFGYFESIPFELEEAAVIEGCTWGKSLWHIVLPLAAPGLGAVAIFAYLHAWNDFTNAVVLTSSESVRPYTVTLYRLLTERGFAQWDLLSAAAFIAVVPILIAFILFQRYFITGLTQGALKG
ncbi:MAG TPA: carbohydrate ABC transporter permease [Spirochaetia bacterium]|nr:carbohydrate ABC transporter permease [Spirochaetia bacterium]